ncbi:hypothetical protein NX059_004254 [Plenodomus lindquistii]|nr:hypothetical protein NX059_004254 [Plenodomus lindquistii]
MPSIILLIGLVILPIIVGTCLAYAGFKAYTKRHFPIHDIESTPTPVRSTWSKHPQQQLELLDLENAELRNPQRPGNAHATFQRSGVTGTVIPTHVAPMAIPLPVGSIGGEGVISFPRPSRFVEEEEKYLYNHTSLHTNTLGQMVMAPHNISPIQCDATAHQPQSQYPQPSHDFLITQTPVIAPSSRRVAPPNPATMQHHAPYDAKDRKAADIWQGIETQSLPLTLPGGSPLPRLEETKERGECEDVASDTLFVIESEDGEGGDDEEGEEIRGSESVVGGRWSTGRSLLRNSLVKSDDKESSVDEMTSAEPGQGRVDVEYDDFVNPARGSAVSVGGGVTRGEDMVFADEESSEKDIRSDEEEDNGASTSTGQEIENEDPAEQQASDEETERTSHKIQHHTQEHNVNVSSTSTRSTSSEIWQDYDSNTSNSQPSPNASDKTPALPSYQPQRQSSISLPPPPPMHIFDTPSQQPPPVLTRANSLTIPRANPRFTEKTPGRDITRANTYTAARPAQMPKFKPAGAQVGSEAEMKRDVLQTPTPGLGQVRDLVGKHGDEDVEMRASDVSVLDGDGVGMGMSTEIPQRSSWASLTTGKRASMGSQTRKRLSAGKSGRNLWGHAVV